jgi:thiol-disulfide isomerase/thioredoxin
MREGTPTPEELTTGTHIVEFNAPWCGPCRTFAPIYETVASRKEYAAKDFWAVDTSSEEGQGLASNYTIRSVPAIVFFVGGGVAEMLVGADVTEAKLVNILDRI